MYGSSSKEDASKQKQSIHAFVFTYPGQGHVTPTLEFAYLLIAKGFSVTYVGTLSTISSVNVQQHHPHLQMVGLPDGLPPEHQRSPFNKEFHQACYALQGQAEKLVEDTILSTQYYSSTHLIISDTFCPWTSKVATKLHLQWIPLWPASFSSFYIAYKLPTLIQRGYVPAKGIDQMTEIVDCLPDLPESIRVSDLPCVFTDPSTPVWFIEFLLDMANTCKDAPILLGNSFDELENGIIQRLRQIYPSIYPLGPLLPRACFSDQLGNISTTTSSRRRRFGEEEKKCMEWLERQRAGSVLYVAFGSVAMLAPDQLRILAQGIQASGRPFLWVIPDMAKPCLPSKDEHENENGLIVSWAPQLQVLNHPSVGGFMSHCGWSSTMEAVCAGVPLIVWPQIGEQTTNAKFIVDEWKVGIRLQLNPDGKTLTGSTTVSHCITHLFQASALRLAIQDFSSSVKKAVSKGGSSYSNFFSFIHSLTNI